MLAIILVVNTKSRAVATDSDVPMNNRSVWRSTKPWVGLGKAVPRMMFTGSIGATRKLHTNLPPMQTCKNLLPRSRICLPSAWYFVPSCCCTGTGYCSTIYLDMMFTPLPVSITALHSAPPISTCTSIDGPLLFTTEVAFEDPGRFRTKTGDILLAGAVLVGWCSRPGQYSFKCSFLFGLFRA